MVLNYIWVGFFLIALVVGLVRLIAFGDTEVFTAMVNSTFEMAKTGVARPVYPDRAKGEGEILNPGINPVLEGESAPRAAALAVARQLNDFFAANPQ